jgi:hypothetical protein
MEQPRVTAAAMCEGTPQARQYLYFCISKARKLSTCELEPQSRHNSQHHSIQPYILIFEHRELAGRGGGGAREEVL